MDRDERPLLKPGEAARALRISPRQLNSWADAGLIPCVIAPTGHRLYRPEDVEAFAASLLGEASA